MTPSDLKFWKSIEGEFTRNEVLSRVAQYRKYFKGLKASSLVLLQGFDPLSTWSLILSAWQENLAVLPLGKGVAKPSIPWALSLENSDGEVSIFARDESFEHECRLYILSSGSTGQPKAIGHSIRGLVCSAKSTVDFYQCREGGSWLLSLDPAQIGGFQILLRMWISGGIVAYGGEPRFVAEALLWAKPDCLSLVPTQLFLLLDQEDTRTQLKACSSILLGGAGVQPSLLEKLRSLNLPVSITYGSSETASQIAGFAPGEFPCDSKDVGRPLAHWTLDSNHDEILIRGEALFVGQFVGYRWERRPDPYSLPDRASFKDGHLFIEGRKDDIFQVGGVNVSPAEILAPLETSYNLSDLLILPRGDDKFGNIPVLIVRSCQEPRLGDLLSRLESIKPVKRPRQIWWLPSSEVSKISRAAIEPLLNSANSPLKRLWTYEKI